MSHMLNLEEQMTGLKRKPSELPGDQPPPKLLKQTTNTTLATAFERESDIDNIAPPVLEKADSCTGDRPIAFPYGKVNDDGSNSSTPPPILPRFPTLTPTKPASNKYFGFEIDESDEEDDSFSKIAQSIDIGDDSLDNVSSVQVQTKTACIGTNTIHDFDDDPRTFTSLKKADTVVVFDSNGSNGESKKNKVIKKPLVKKVLTPKKNSHKEKVEIVKEKSVILDSLESLKTIQKMPSGTLIEKIMKFGEQEIILPTDPSLALYESKEDSVTGSSLASFTPRPSFQVVSNVLQSIEEENKTTQCNSGIPKLECVSSEDLTASEQSDIDSSAPTLQKMSIATPTKSPKKFIHGGIREIVFSFDTTGSMYSYMEEAKDRMREIVKRLKLDIPGVRLAFVAHGDYFDLKNDRYLIKFLDFGATIDEICNFFEYLPITHGGDADECYELVLRKVRESLSWTTGSQRCLVMIGDSDPHEPGYTYEEFTNDIDWKEETKKLNDMGVRIYGTQVGYRSDFYKQISQMTGGAHLRLESANRTPDMLLAVCLREGNLKLLKTFEGEVMKRQENKDDIDLELARLFSSLKNIPDNIAMKFKQKLLEGEENGKKAIKRSNESTEGSPGSKIAKLAKKNISKSPEIKKKKSSSDQIAKNLVKKALKGGKDKSKVSLSKSKDKKLLLKKTKLTDKQKAKPKLAKGSLAGKNKQVKKTPDAKKKKLKPGASLKGTKQPKASSNVKKLKTLKDAKLKKTIPKAKQTATKLKAKAVVKALLKSKKKVVTDKTVSKLKKPVKDKKSDTENKVSPKKTGTASKAVISKKKEAVVKTKVKKEIAKETVKRGPGRPKKVEEQPTEPKKRGRPPKTKTETVTEKSKPTKDSPKKTPTKKSTDKPKPVQVKRPKNLQPREIASIAKFVQGPLSCITWEQWVPLIAHEKKTGNWSKGKNGCPGYCNSDFNKQNSNVPMVYEFAVSPPESSKKYPVYFHSESENVWELCKDSFVLGEIERVIKGKGSISVRIGTVNKDDGALFLKTVEHIKNMFDYAWNSNSSKDTARKQNLVKEGFIIAKV